MAWKHKTCSECGESFEPQVIIDGVRKDARSRSKCFKCLPYQNNRVTVIDGVFQCRDGFKACRICKRFLPLCEFSPNRKDGYLNSYCKECAAKKVHSLRQRWKQMCVDYKGGKCVRCGYDRCIAAMEFHHRDPEQKDFQISRASYRLELTEEVRAELDKCDLLCSNCHKEVEYATPGEVALTLS